MKNILAIFSSLLIFASCGNHKTEINDTATTDSTKIIDSLNLKTDSLNIWVATIEGNSGITLYKERKIAADSLTVQHIIALQNETYPEIPLQLDKISNDTLFLSINDSKYLTEQMGTSGPEVYFAEATYNLTEIKEIKYVSFQFKEGDHAMPDVFSRINFLENIK